MKKKSLGQLVWLIVDKLSVFGGNVSKVLLVSLVALITLDVLSRQLLGKPTYVTVEISGYLLVGVTYLSLADTQKIRKHMRALILVSRFPQKTQWIFDIAAHLLMLSFVVWFTWSTVRTVRLGYVLGDISQTKLRTPLWIPQLMMPVGMGLLALQLIRQIVESLHFERWERVAADSVQPQLQSQTQTEQNTLEEG